jgi:hypothetical protein
MAINKNTNDILERVRKKQILTADLLQKPLKKICKKKKKKKTKERKFVSIKRSL